MESLKEKKLIDIYNNLSYLDTYGTQIIIIIIITLIVFLFFAYSYTQTHIESIKSDWINQRCKPYIIPFAGYIYNDDPTLSSSDATKKNLEYCTQNITKELSADALALITYSINSINTAMNDVAEGINSSRGMFDKVRTNLQSVSEEIMGRLLNFTVPIQQLVISFKDMMAKIQGILTSSLYTSLGTYYTLKSLLGAIAEFLVKILIALAAMIIIMWLTPFTWGVAGSMTAVFIAVSIPMALMLAFMSEVLHVNLNLNIPHVPKKPSCFDENTLLEIINEYNEIEKIPIKDVKVGSKIYADNAIITAKLILSSEGIDMYKLNDVIVSDSHLVLYNGEWIRVDRHPNAKKIKAFKQLHPFIYCLNTSTKKIHINSNIFCDWDEIVTNKQFYYYTEKLIHIINNNKNNQSKNFTITQNTLGLYTHKYLDVSINNSDILTKKGFKDIHNIKIGDKLYSSKIFTNNAVYGIVHILDNKDFDNKIHLLTEDSEFFIRPNSNDKFNITKIFDYNSCIDLF